MAVGLASASPAAAALLWLMRRVSLPGEGLYPLRVLAIGGVIYGVASVAPRLRLPRGLRRRPR